MKCENSINVNVTNPKTSTVQRPDKTIFHTKHWHSTEKCEIHDHQAQQNSSRLKDCNSVEKSRYKTHGTSQKQFNKLF